MASNQDVNFFNHFKPVLQNGHVVRTDGGLIIFVRLKDSKYVGFRDDQIDVKALENHIRSAASAGGSDNVQFNIGSQASSLGSKLMIPKQADNASSATAVVNIQSRAHAAEASVGSSVTMCGLGSQQEFDQAQLSLSDNIAPNVKNLISSLNLDQRQLQHQPEQPAAQLSPSSDRDLQSLAELVTSSLEQEESATMEFCQSQGQQQQQQPQQQQQSRQQQQPKSLDDVRISLSSLGQSTFHIDMNKAASAMLAHSHPTSSLPPTHQNHKTGHQQHQQNQRLAPIQTLLSSLRQKGSQQSSNRQADTAVFTSSLNPALSPSSKSSLAHQFDKTPGQGSLQTSADREMEAFFKSVAIHFENSQDKMSLGDRKEDQPMQMLQMGESEQSLQQNLQAQAVHHTGQLLPQTKGLTGTGGRADQTQDENRTANLSKNFPNASEKNSQHAATSCQPNKQVESLKRGIESCPSGPQVTNINAFSSNNAYIQGSSDISSSQKRLLQSTSVDMLGVDSSDSSLTTDISSSYIVSVTSAAEANLQGFSERTVVNSSSPFLTNLSRDVQNSKLVPSKIGAADLTAATSAVSNNNISVAQLPPYGSVGASDMTNNSSSNSSNNSSSSSASTVSPVLNSCFGDQIWMNVKTPHARLLDKKATQALIQLVRRPGIRARLTSLNIKKKDVWNEIGLEMKKQGFVFSNAGEKCSQKWRNMERTFNDYELSKDIPSLSHKKQPDFYLELSALLKDKQEYHKNLTDEEDYKKKLLANYMETTGTGSHNRQDEEPQAACYLNPPENTTLCSSASAGPQHLNITSASVTPVISDEGSGSAASTCTTQSPSTTSNVSCPPASSFSSLTGPLSSSASPSGSASCAFGCQSVSSSQLAENRFNDKVESLETEVKRLQELVQTQNKEMERMSEVMTSVQTLLREQRRDGEVVRTESGRRFSELKALIGQNQREKMKFMYDFLKAIKPARQPKRLKPQANSGGKGPT